MSTDYWIYTEAKVKDKWYAIDGVVPYFDEKKGKLTVEMRQSNTYWSGSRSYFSEAYDKLCDIGRFGKFSELSDAIKNEWKESVKEEAEGHTTYSDLVIVKLVDFDKSVPMNAHDYHGLVHKNAIFSYEHGDIEELWPAEHEELEGLTPAEMEQYQYYEWDNPMGWLARFKTISERVHNVIATYLDVNFLVNADEYRLVVIRC